MAKLSSINKNNRRIKLSDKFYQKRSKLKISWIALRQLGLQGKIPGMVKSSW